MPEKAPWKGETAVTGTNAARSAATGIGTATDATTGGRGPERVRDLEQMAGVVASRRAGGQHAVVARKSALDAHATRHPPDTSG